MNDKVTGSASELPEDVKAAERTPQIVINIVHGDQKQKDNAGRTGDEAYTGQQNGTLPDVGNHTTASPSSEPSTGMIVLCLPGPRLPALVDVALFLLIGLCICVCACCAACCAACCGRPDGAAATVNGNPVQPVQLCATAVEWPFVRGNCLIFFDRHFD